LVFAIVVGHCRIQIPTDLAYIFLYAASHRLQHNSSLENRGSPEKNEPESMLMRDEDGSTLELLGQTLT